MPVTKVKIRWNNKGFKEILNGSELEQEMWRTAQNVKQEAGDGFEINAWHSDLKGGRPALSVKASTAEAKKAEATDKSLTKAVQRCRIG